MESLFLTCLQKSLSQKGEQNDFIMSDIGNNSLSTSEQILNDVNTQKKNQKQRKINHRGRKIVPENTVASTNTYLKDVSPLSAMKEKCPSKSVSEIEMKPLDSPREYVDLESSPLISR